MVEKIAHKLTRRPKLVALTAVLMLIPLVMTGGVVYALIQRIQEIGKGEEDDAKNY